MIAAGEKNWLFYPKQNQNKNEATLETTQVPVFQKHVGALTFISKNFKTVQWQLITKVTYNYQNEQEGTFPGCKSPVSPACHPLQNAPLQHGNQAPPVSMELPMCWFAHDRGRGHNSSWSQMHIPSAPTHFTFTPITPAPEGSHCPWNYMQSHLKSVIWRLFTTLYIGKQKHWIYIILDSDTFKTQTVDIRTNTVLTCFVTVNTSFKLIYLFKFPNDKMSSMIWSIVL